MTGRERFHAAVEGNAVAFAVLVWERLAEFVHQPAGGWWRETGLAQRLVGDAAALSGADAMVVAPVGRAVDAVCESGVTGREALDRLGECDESRRGYELVDALHRAAPFAVIFAVPDPPALQRAVGIEGDEGADAAGDAVIDLARGGLEAGADGLAVVGGTEHEVRAGGERVRGLANYYGRPLIAVWVANDDASAWAETGVRGAVASLSADGAWPEIADGIVVTPGDVSGRWNPEQLHGAGGRRP